MKTPSFPWPPLASQSQPGGSTMLRLIPTWKGNLLIFGILIFMVLAYFFWQARQAQETFLDHARLNSRLLAAAIERNARSAVMSQAVVETIMDTFLGNSARFVDYLDAVEPFSGAELSAFAAEAGLAGIRIQSPDGRVTEGPAQWLPAVVIACLDPAPSLRHLADDHLYILTWKRTGDTGCIVVGIPAARIEKLQEQIGLPRLLASLSGLAGIHYVRLDPAPGGVGLVPATPEVLLIDTARQKIAETRLSMDRGRLVVGLDAAPFYLRIQRIWREFFAFSAVLAGFGIFFSWLLHRFQNAYMDQVRSFDGRLARQREDASLGRAAASITHEIRNPLNAINMGLQRLDMEAAGSLEEEQRHLIRSMLAAVQRTDGIVADLKRFSGPLAPRFQPVSLGGLVETIITLYQHQCDRQGIRISLAQPSDSKLAADPEMLGEVVENLIKNAVEAQKNGGFVRAVIKGDDQRVSLSVENPGRLSDPARPERILEPYFTTKTRGTGLGLAIAGRIIRAHAGSIAVTMPRKDVLRIRVTLPRHPAGNGPGR